MRHIDVAIIGGSLAGSTCAHVLGQRGIEAVAFERDEFPRDKVCGGFLSPGAVRLFDELGMLSEIRTAGAVEINAAEIRTSGFQVTFPLLRSGLAISRRTLDAVFARRVQVERGNVRSVRDFKLDVDGSEIRAKVIIDAAGKLSRFTPHETADEFGVQFYEPAEGSPVLDFWFFEDGYGGAVSVENGRRNSCFLVKKSALARYINKPSCLVTGPLAYNSGSSEWMTIGDSAGMIDPFCGEGMRHAIDTGRLAAQIAAEGLNRGWSYEDMRARYLSQWRRGWGRKRALARWARSIIRRPQALRSALKVKPELVLDSFWR